MSSGYARPEALRSTEWLEEHLYDSGLRIVDGSFHLPGSGRDPRAEYAAGHIPGAVFFDIDDVCDPSSSLPHMLPPPDLFAAKMQALGIADSNHIVVYDQPGSYAASRVWWTLRAFGHGEVSVLDGGLAKWLAAGLPVTDQPARQRQISFTAHFEPSLVRSAADVVSAIGNGTTQIVDNRPAGRYAGIEPEPRPSRRTGHVPNSRNVPFSSFFDVASHGVWRSADDLAAMFAAAGIDLSKPVIAYCGSGVTACTTAFAAYMLGRVDVAVYDGSWAEWGNRHDLPVDR